MFYDKKGNRIKGEKGLQLLFMLVCKGVSPFDVNREVNNGRGPVDFKFSHGRNNKALVEFKLASNTSLERNLKAQVEIYEKANQTDKSLKVIVYFSENEFTRVVEILKRLRIANDKNIILIDGRNDNKPSASNA
jgi:hypothetical protein